MQFKNLEMKKYLDKNYWLNFIDKNENFSNTCVLKDSFSNEDQTILYNSVTEAIYRRISDVILDKGFRVYNDGKEASGKETIDFFKQNPPKSEEDLILYLKRIFKNKFGIIMNNNEAFSEQLASRVYEMVEPLFDLAGVPPLGNEITVFIGDYGWTPLGIHKDQKGENVIHFHLGPGRKQMYIWDEAIYEKLVGKNVYNNKNIEPILYKAKKYDFGAGDIFYMPWYENHVGYTEDISIGVSLWFKSTDNYTFSKKILEHFILQFLPNDQKIIPPQINYLDNDDTFENFKNSISSTLDDSESTLDDFLKKIYLDHKYTLLSNSSWSTVPIENKIDDLDDDFLYDKIISIVKPFKIIYENYKNEKMYIFVRGNRFSIKYFKDIEDLIRRLNNNETIEINELLKTLTIPNDAFLYVVLIFYKFRGISIS